MKKKILARELLVILGVAIGLPTFAAQNEGEASVARAESAAAIEEVIVQARRREESLQEVPISITAFSAEQVAIRGNLRVQDVAELVPNLVFIGSNSNLTNFTVRGIQAFPRASRAGFESAAPTYVDGVVRSRPSAVNQFLSDVETIEFLRGPQGTLFGRGSIAGAINITTKKPSEEFEGNVDLQYGNYDLIQGQGYVSGPIIEGKLSASLTAFSQKRDGFDENVFDGGDLGDADIYGGRFKLLATPSENLSIQLTVDGTKEDARGSAEQWFDGPFAIPDRDRVTNIDQPTIIKSDQVGGDITVNYDIGSIDALFTSISSYRNFDSQRALDFGSYPASVPALGTIFTTSSPDEDQWTQEFRLTSTWDKKLSYVVGLYYFKADLDDDITAVLPFLGPPNSVSQSNIETESYSVFANFDYRLSDQLSLIAGFRYTDEERRLTQEQDPGSGAVIGTPAFPRQTDNLDETQFLPSLGIRYAINDDANVYATIAKGFRGGGWNNKEIAGPGEIESFADLAFDPEEVWSYELGAKTTWLDNRLVVNAAVFFSDYSDIQSDVQRFVDVFGSPTQVGRVDNAGTATLYGFELETQTLITEELTVRAAVGYTSAEFDEFDTLDLFGNPISFEGNSLESAPEYTANAGILYRTAVSNDLDFVLSMDVVYSDSYFSDPANTPGLEIDSRTLVNARIGIAQSAEKGWELFLWGNNLFDEDDIVSRFIDPRFGNTGQFAAPRTYGVRFAVHF